MAPIDFHRVCFLPNHYPKETRSLANISRSTTSARVGQVAYLHVKGDDRAGIVADVTRLLSSHSMNIERMETTVKPSRNSK